MPQSETILIAHPDREQGSRLAAALFDAGFEAMHVRTPEDLLRTTVGSNPRLVLVDAHMPQVGAHELHRRLALTGLTIPPIVLVGFEPGDAPVAAAPAGVSLLPAERSEPDQVVETVRLLLLATRVGGELDRRVDRFHGDLTRVSFGDLVQALRQHVFSGEVAFVGAADSGLWVRDGAVVDAWRTPVRGVKAFNRLAGLASGAFTVRLAEVPVDRRIEGDVDALVLAAVDERVGLREVLEKLPSAAARVEVCLTKDFFSLKFSETERQVMARAKEAANLGDLLDRVAATDLEAGRAVVRLHHLGVLRLREPAGQVHVLTDSTADLEPALARRLGIHVAAVSIQLGEQLYKDGIDLTPEDFHRRLRDRAETPRSHPVTRGEVLEILRRLVVTGDVVAVMCSAALSQSVENARQALAQGMPELVQLRRETGAASEPAIHVVDSRQCSGPLGMLAVLARRMLELRLPPAEVARRLESLSSRFRTLLTVRSLEYLHRGRGIGEPQQVARQRPDSRWLLALEGGELKVVGEAEPEAAREELITRLGQELDPGRAVLGALVHASAPAEAQQLRERLLEAFQVRELMEHPIGPAVTCNTGPGAVGAALLQPTDEELELLGHA